MRKLFELKWKCSLAIFSGHTHTCDSLTEILECVTKWSSWTSVRVQLLFNTYAIRCHQTTHHVSITSCTEWSETSTSYPVEQFTDIVFWSFPLEDRMCHKNLHVQIELQRINIHENRLRIYLWETKRFYAVLLVTCDRESDSLVRVTSCILLVSKT